MADRTSAYFDYLIEKGAHERYGPFWQTPERVERVELERSVIKGQGFESYFVILASITEFCRQENIPYGPGRGSVGGCYIAFLMGIHEVDSIEWDLLFERFLNEDRVAYPDVDLDFSQRHRDRILQFIHDTYGRDGNVVLQVAAFARAGGRSVIDHMLNAFGQTDPNAGATATNLRKCLPDGALSAGVKHERELAWWLDNGHGDPTRFRTLAEQAGWLEHMLKLDGLYSHLARHAAGVVILNQEDLRRLPRCSADGETQLTAFDMYDLDALGYLKIDVLGLRTLDVVADADRFTGGDGSTRRLMQIWRDHRDDPEPYQLLSEADTVGIFQMETSGYRRTLKEFLPDRFDHVVQLNALYRPGALGYKRESDGKDMVHVFIERRHHREGATYPHNDLRPVLAETHGIILYQEQSMKIAQVLAGFTLKEADALRKAIGKKKIKEMNALKPKFLAGCCRNGVAEGIAESVWQNISAAVRYSWNKSHAVEYAIITWLTAWFKAKHKPAFYAALLNSYGGDKDRMSEAIAEARQHVPIEPPDINIAENDFIAQGDQIIFGLNGVRGLGESNRQLLLIERLMGGPFASYEDLCRRLPSLPSNMKLALIRCGAFDATDDRTFLLSRCIKPGKAQKEWTVAEHVNHYSKTKNPKPVPDERHAPSDKDLADGEIDAIGFYVSHAPLAHISRAMARCGPTTYGGEIERVTVKEDRRGQTMAQFTLLTPAMTKQRCVVFASVYERFGPYLKKGEQVLLRGREDGGSLLVDLIWYPDDVRHFKTARVSRNGGTEETEKLTDGMAQVEKLEDAGYKVRLV